MLKKYIVDYIHDDGQRYIIIKPYKFSRFDRPGVFICNSFCSEKFLVNSLDEAVACVDCNDIRLDKLNMVEQTLAHKYLKELRETKLVF